MLPEDFKMALAMCLQERRRVFCELLLRDLDRTMRLLQQAAKGNDPSTARRNVVNAWSVLEDIERYLTTLDLESGQQEAIRKGRVALVARLQLLALAQSQLRRCAH
jgi:hypothetical protein